MGCNEGREGDEGSLEDGGAGVGLDQARMTEEEDGKERGNTGIAVSTESRGNVSRMEALLTAGGLDRASEEASTPSEEPCA